MKKILGLIIIIISLSLVSCKGNFAPIDLKEPIDIPESGMIEKIVFDEIKNTGSIAVFKGKSGDYEYKWTVFGSELSDSRDINLSVEIEKNEEGIRVKFLEGKDFGFSSLLSIYIKDKWSCESATAFYKGENVYSVSITGSDETILNLSVNRVYSELIILPDARISDKKNEITGTSSPVDEPAINETTNNTDSNSDILIDANEITSETTEESKVSTTEKKEESKSTTAEKDKYYTDPVPDGKPSPVEPQDKEINDKKTCVCTFSIECVAIINNIDKFDPDKRELIPSDGIILEEVEVEFSDGESVFDVLKRVCEENGIHLESSWTPMYNSAYIEGINNIYEKDCGALSGWQYRVNGWYPNYGSSRYKLIDGDKVEFRFTCDLGNDVGNDWMVNYA